jgi:hypothetical protein
MVVTGAGSGAVTGTREMILCGSMPMAFGLANCPDGLLVCPATPPGPLSSPAGRRGGANSHILFFRNGQGTTGLFCGSLADSRMSRPQAGATPVEG